MNFLKSLFRKPDSFRKEGLIIKHAFTIGGRQYFELDSIYNLSYKRGVAATKVYEEVRMKCDYEYLKAHVTAMDNIFNGKEIKANEFFQLKKLNDQLKERLFHIVDTDIIYKLASVVFFDKNESVTDYDFAYAAKKIARWKKHGVNAFFLQEPLQRLIPFLKQPGVNLESFSQVIQEVNKIHWEFIFDLLSVDQKKDYSQLKDYYVKETSPELVS